MKKFFVVIAMMFIGTATFAQKGSVTKADFYYNKGDYASAKAEIDMAITIEKNIGKSKTWFARGKIYQGIATSEDTMIQALDNEAIQKSVEAYNKVLGMEKETAPNAIFANANIEAIWGSYLNKGGEYYGEDKFSDALASFEKALLVKEGDSLTLLYAGVSAQQTDQVDKTLDYYYQMVANGDGNSDVYSTLIYLERYKKKDNEKALIIVSKAKEAFPDEKKYIEEEISLLLKMDKIDEAKAKLEKEIAADPDNVYLHLNLGVLYDNIGGAMASEDKNDEAKEYFNKAKESYLNAVKVDPDNYIGNYNIGAIHINLAKEYYDEVRDMDLKAYDKFGAAKEAKAEAILKDGLSYMEKATTVNPDDIGGLQALSRMYTQLKMMDKAEVILDKIDVLEAGQ